MSRTTTRQHATRARQIKAFLEECEFGSEAGAEKVAAIIKAADGAQELLEDIAEHLDGTGTGDWAEEALALLRPALEL
jgi:hypothetical protein